VLLEVNNNFKYFTNINDPLTGQPVPRWMGFDYHTVSFDTVRGNILFLIPLLPFRGKMMHIKINRRKNDG